MVVAGSPSEFGKPIANQAPCIIPRMMRIQATRRSRFIGTLPDGLRRESAGESEDPAHARVSEVDAVAEHHRAGACDHADIVLTAVLNSRRRDTRSFPYGLMHPNAADPGIAAVVHDPLRDLRSRYDHHAIDAPRD